ncbi:MAG: HAMP domain-containing histidine kinase [Candidatus Melainabacteria bacterium]|nr:HAMP domain-containing histidine kinase [Candidatus Melainabacteria bacterium]
MKLQQKALLLVLLPLLFDMGLILILCFVLNSADKESTALLEAQKLSTLSERITRCAFDVGSDAFQQQRRVDNNIHKRLLPGRMSRLMTMLGDFRRLCLKSPLKVSYLSLADKCEKVASAFGAAQLPQNPSFLDIISRYKKVEPLISEIVADLETIQRNENELLEKLTERERLFRDLANKIALGGILANLLIATLLTILFYRSTTKRLYQVLKNTLRLEQRQALIPPQSTGSDEIAQLEQTFYEVGTRLLRMEEAKQELIAMVSHDLRSPLSYQAGVLRLLSEGVLGELTVTGSKQIDKAEKSLGRLIRMISDILDIEKLDAGMLSLNVEKHSLKEIIEEAANLFEWVARDKEITLTWECRAGSYLIDGDRLLQVIVNLVGNALKFTDNGGEVKISARDESVGFSVSVSDNGRGIPDSQLSQVFDRFQQVNQGDNAERRGYGLGLSICKALVEAQGGDIEATSKVGVGSSFEVYIPAQHAD